VPVLTYPDLERATTWLTDTFGFVESLRWSGPDGVISWVELDVGNGVVMLERRVGAHPGGPRIVVLVRDAAAQHRCVLAAGVTPVSPPVLKPEGVLEFDVEDLAGHRWTFGSLHRVVPASAWGAEENVAATYPGTVQ
jgi:uncharacterized glyoxalase superfamily protein PhnB